MTARGHVSSSVGAVAPFPTPAPRSTQRPGWSVHRSVTLPVSEASATHMSEPAGSGPAAGASAGSSPSSAASAGSPFVTASVCQSLSPVTRV